MPSINIGGREVRVDQQDAPLLDSASWVVRKGGGTFYVLRSIYADGIYQGYESLHRSLTNCPAGMVVDHINGDGLDNRRANLRVCTNAENLRNRKMHLNNRSGFKGVYFDDSRRGKPWRAQITAHGKKHRLGRFDTAEEASAAYRKAAPHMHGEFARAS
ncbi:HNH endonuclease [Pseudomonas sp. G.S.17]|uniref:HNH endonuclease n=1 Tax=Pseudomonas sp. G.S.17 TaxID=3137451 RepID=UPI00311CE072